MTKVQRLSSSSRPVNMTTRCGMVLVVTKLSISDSSESSGCAVSSDIIAHVGTWDSNNHLALNRSELRFSRGDHIIPEDGTPKPSSITIDEASWISSRREVCIKAHLGVTFSAQLERRLHIRVGNKRDPVKEEVRILEDSVEVGRSDCTFRIMGLQYGQEYFFRVQLAGEEFSSWSGVCSYHVPKILIVLSVWRNHGR